MRLNRLDLPVLAVPEAVRAAAGAADAAPLDARTRQALIKLLGRAIDLIGDEATRALAPRLVAYLASPPTEFSMLPAGHRAQGLTAQPPRQRPPIGSTRRPSRRSSQSDVPAGSRARSLASRPS